MSERRVLAEPGRVFFLALAVHSLAALLIRTFELSAHDQS
jgi:hypothetical protein